MMKDPKVTMDTDFVCFSLANGVKMPILAYSVSSSEIGGATLALETALKAGFRHIVVNTTDKNELEIGHVIRRWIENKKLSRDDFFITVKITFDSSERINLKSRFVQTLYTLSCDIVDLLVIDADSIQSGRVGIHSNDVQAKLASLWKGAVGLLKEGSVRALGVACNDDDMLHMLCKKTEDPPHVLHLNYCDSLNTRSFHTSAALCRQHKIQALIDIDDLDRVRDMNNAGHDKIIGQVCEKTGRTFEQVLVRSCMDRGMAVVARFPDRKSIQKSFQVYDFSIERDDLINLFRAVT